MGSESTPFSTLVSFVLSLIPNLLLPRMVSRRNLILGAFVVLVGSASTGSESGRMPGNSPGASIGSTTRPPSSMKLSTKRSSDGSPLGSSLGAGCPTMMGTEQEAWMTSMALDSLQSSGRSVLLQKYIFDSNLSPGSQAILIIFPASLGEGKVNNPQPALTVRFPPIS